MAILENKVANSNIKDIQVKVTVISEALFWANIAVLYGLPLREENEGGVFLKNILKNFIRENVRLAGDVAKKIRVILKSSLIQIENAVKEIQGHIRFIYKKDV